MNKIIFVLAVLCIASSSAQAQRFTESITKTYTFEKKNAQNAVLIYNIDGDVQVEGTTGDHVIVVVEKIITAKTEARLAIGKAEIQLGSMDLADSLIFYVKGIGQEFGRNPGRKNNSGHGGWGYIWNQGKNHNDLQYEYTMNFKIKVPRNVHVMASTVNDGDVLVSNTNGEVIARNVNGHIKLKDISGATNANTINGNVDIDYTKNPGSDCRYYTLNGDIRVNFPSIVSGRMSFKSFNGDLYTNFDPLTSLPPVVNKKESDKGVKYKIEDQHYQIRTGGPLLDVETFNGDAYLKEKINK